MSYEDVLAEAARESDRVMVLTAENRAAIRGLPSRLGPRFLDFGIAEQTMVGAAAGLALRGRRPICHALAAFLTLRAYEFIRTDVGIAELPVKLIGGVPGFLSEANGPTHQAVEDIALMRMIPQMLVFCPSDELELADGMRVLLRDPRPWYVRFNAQEPVAPHQPFEIGRAETLEDGSEIALLTYGFMLREVVRAHQILTRSGHSVRVVNLRTLKPLDEAAVLSAAGCRLVVTVEDHFLAGGLYSMVAETLLKHGRSAWVLPLALEERWFTPALLGDVLRHEGFTAEQIASRVEGHLSRS